MEKQKPTYPIIFVTGIGQTWTTLKNGAKERWNLIPSSKEVMFDEFEKVDYLKIFSSVIKTAFSAVSGVNAVSFSDISEVYKKLFKYCIADENGALPDKTNVRIYGPNSFDKLAMTDFNSGCLTETNDSLLDRLLRDIPCTELMNEYGAENMYCFNYSTFSNLYDDADLLNKMILDVIEDQKDKTGAKKVILVPMSMGATIVNAYLDKYFLESSAYVAKVISIVGAWNGSDALADFLLLKMNDDFYDKLSAVLPEKSSGYLRFAGKDSVKTTVKLMIDCFIETVLLNTSSFTALIPKERYNDVVEKLFTSDALRRKPSLKAVKKEADRYHKAQETLADRMHMLNDVHGVEFYFISGYGLDFGEKGRDFSFLSFFESAEKTNSDGVIQISSTSPGTSYIYDSNQNHFSGRFSSPDGMIDASTSVFPENSWYFYKQEHELGYNNTALRLAGDIALGKVSSVNNELYTQFNEWRDVRGVRELIDKAKFAVEQGILPDNKSESLLVSVEQAELMLSRTDNNPVDDVKIIDCLKDEISDVLL